MRYIRFGLEEKGKEDTLVGAAMCKTKAMRLRVYLVCKKHREIQSRNHTLGSPQTLQSRVVL